jgi:voltage-gated potassium channel
MKENLKQRIHKVLDSSDHSNSISKSFNVFLILLIVLNTVAVTIETVKSIEILYRNLFRGFEIFSVCIFTIEYFLRLWSITASNKYSKPILGRVKFIFTGSALIDLFAILPFYLPMIIGFDLRFIRILRLFRLIRILKISRYMHATKMISNVFKAKREELLITLVLIFFLIIIVSSIMFYTEHEAQPEKFSSIPETMWWSVATLTTVGYGDIFPITVLGKTLASIIALLGIGMVALPAGILASGFSDELKKIKSHNHCPHCLKEIE